MTDRSKPLYQPWVEGDLSEDVDYQALGHLQKWMYRTLCQKAFVCSERPDLPDDDNQLWKLSGCPDRKYWDEHKRAVKKMFKTTVVEGIKVLWRARLRADWDEIQRIRKQNKLNAERRWKNNPTEPPKNKDLHTTDRSADVERTYSDRNANGMQGSKEVRKEVNTNTKSRDAQTQRALGPSLVSDLAKTKTLTPQQEKYKTVKSIAHHVLWLLGHGYQDNADLREEAKTWCAQNNIPYNSEEVNRALDIAAGKVKSA